MEETWWEHHVISFVPEFNSILTIECCNISCSCESCSGKDHSEAPAVYPKATVVDWTIADTEESGSNWFHDTIPMEDSHPVEVTYSEESVEGMSTIFSLAHFNGFEESTDSS